MTAHAAHDSLLALALLAQADNQESAQRRAQIDRSAREAYADGATYKQIGMVLGISKQAAHERYSKTTTGEKA